MILLHPGLSPVGARQHGLPRTLQAHLLEAQALRIHEAVHALAVVFGCFNDFLGLAMLCLL